MNANTIKSRILPIPAAGLILLSAFAFASRVLADQQPNQVNIQPQILPLSSQTAHDVGITNENWWEMTSPGLRYVYIPDFTRFQQAETLPWGMAAGMVGFDYTHKWGTRNDVNRTTDMYNIGDLQLKVGLPKDMDLELKFPIWKYTDTTIKRQVGDETQTDSFSNGSTGDLLASLKWNFIGNNGGPFGWSMMVNGLIPTASSNDRNNFNSWRLTTIDDTNNDNGRRNRDRNGNEDNYGLGVSTQFTYDFCCGMQVGINSGVMLGHSDCYCCCCCAWFDNRISLTKRFGDTLALQTTFATEVSTAKHSDWQGTILGNVIYKPTPRLQIAVGPYYNVNERGNNIGGSVQLSIFLTPHLVGGE